MNYFQLSTFNFQLIISFLLVFGCGVRKESQSTYREAGRVEVLRGDSLWLERMEHLWATRKMELRHIEFMEPDSAERQFVRSVTVVHSEEEAGGEASSSLTAGTEVRARAEMEAEASEEDRFEAGTKKGGLLRGILAAVCLSGLWLFLMKRNK
jgi:hypothetical protein